MGTRTFAETTTRSCGLTSSDDGRDGVVPVALAYEWLELAVSELWLDSAATSVPIRLFGVAVLQHTVSIVVQCTVSFVIILEDNIVCSSLGSAPLRGRRHLELWKSVDMVWVRIAEIGVRMRGCRKQRRTFYTPDRVLVPKSSRLAVTVC